MCVCVCVAGGGIPCYSVILRKDHISEGGGGYTTVGGGGKSGFTTPKGAKGLKKLKPC